MPSYLIAHDVDTSSVKAALIHRSGTIAATAEEPYPVHQPRPGWVEQDPEDMFAVDLKTGKHDGPRKPCSEKGLHLEIYRRRPQIRAVIHTH